ncbi:uncharacterized protein F4822DRAFT_444663 [Hypoxylon trugodes]|uniref:uncharacterized protein n=1 Tax=Hypoxylon trugodes TaxID=326681 RepID=UPI0021A0C9D8|nr:uncharacterized protein F4822DRAFT_444663 [Hypoxylon trugodes]KAI1386177.1 hypothetical protein F4822DRAFT_444663 [Hypoxylon trugodes]
MVKIQIVSDLHLEMDWGYDTYSIPPQAPILALLGDIGSLIPPHRQKYINFIERHLAKFQIADVRTCLCQYEYQTLMRAKERDSTLGRFMLLDSDRLDIPGENVTLLGTTLFTTAPPDHRFDIFDYYYDTIVDIENWDGHQHIAAHHDAVKWLSDTVAEIRVEDPERVVAILTHHSPSQRFRALGYLAGEDQDGITLRWSSDMSVHPVWYMDNIKLWAFGCTGYNCDYVDEATKTRIYSNQRGRFRECSDFGLWKVVDVAPMNPRPPLEELKRTIERDRAEDGDDEDSSDIDDLLDPMEEDTPEEDAEEEEEEERGRSRTRRGWR